MDSFLKERLEEYLAGELPGREQEEFERRLATDPNAAGLIAEFGRTAELFESIRVDESEAVGPAPGFYARVDQRIEEERAVPFWEIFLRPATMRRLAFATLMWLFALGSVTLYSDTTGSRDRHLAQHIMVEQPVSHDYWVRMGPDLQRNRDSMFTAVMATGE